MNAGYYRRSVSRDPSKEVSREAQAAACRRLSGGELAEYVDWGISGGTARRPEYQRLRADIEAGAVTAVYAYSISRLGRNVRELLDFLELCRDRGVPVTTEAEGTIGGQGAFANFMLLIMAGLAAMERELASERTLAAVRVRRERGDVLGNEHYGDREGEDWRAVVAAYREAGGLQAATRLLNAPGGPPSRLGRPWGVSTVRAVMRHRAPELLPAKRGKYAAATAYAFSGLLRCPHDGSILAAKRNHGRWPSYGCRLAAERPEHPRPRYVTEAAIRAWAEPEAARLRVPDLGAGGEDATAERVALEERRRRVTIAYLDGLIDRAERDARLADLEADAERVERRQAVPVIPDAIRWDWPPRKLNAVLRALWEHVELGPDLRPVRAEWTVPEWRS